MTQNEKEALIIYLEFNLLKLIERYEQSVTPTTAYNMYDDAYEIVSDMERSLDTVIEIQRAASIKKP